MTPHTEGKASTRRKGGHEAALGSAALRSAVLGRFRWSGAAQRSAVLGGLLALGFLLPALLAPLLATHDPFAIDLFGSLAPPGPEHLLGQDDQGGDIFSRLLFGARISLLVGVATVSVSATVGISVGLLAGYRGGWVDQVLMRLVDVLLAFPGLLLAIALVAVLGPGLSNVVLALTALGWTSFARLVRGQVLAEKGRDYVTAAQALGAGGVRVMLRYLLPNLMAPVLVQASFAVAGAILSEASLSFLGLGVSAGTPSWGAMLSEGRHVLLEAPRVSAAPGMAILVVVLGFNLLGDALGDLLDPRRRG